jgi:RNA polymerase primary sigma factor
MPSDGKWDTLIAAGIGRKTDYNPFERTDGIGVSYFKEIGQIPLLTRARELELAGKVQVGERRIKQLMAKCLRKSGSANHHSFDGKSLQEIMVFLEELAENDGVGWRNTFMKLREVEAEIRRAKCEMINSNLRLVVNIAKAYVNRGLPLLDLIQEGNVGLIKAVSKYDPARGCKFSTYASWWIKQAILRAIPDKSRTIRVPGYVLEIKHKMRNISYDIFRETDREPTEDEIASRMEVSPQKLRKIMDVTWGVISLQATLDDGGRPLGDVLIDKEAIVPFEQLIQDMDSAHVTEKALNGLNPREQEIIRLRFGIGKDSAQTLEEIGKKFGISKERVRQIEKRALRKAHWRVRNYLDDLKR